MTKKVHNELHSISYSLNQLLRPSIFYSK